MARRCQTPKEALPHTGVAVVPIRTAHPAIRPVVAVEAVAVVVTSVTVAPAASQVPWAAPRQSTEAVLVRSAGAVRTALLPGSMARRGESERVGVGEVQSAALALGIPRHRVVVGWVEAVVAGVGVAAACRHREEEKPP